MNTPSYPNWPRRLAVATSLVMAGLAAPASATEVNIYSYRQPDLIDPLLKAFTAQTGIKTNVVFANVGLNERLAAEGPGTPADLLFTVDAGRLSEAKEAGLTQPIASAAVARIPASFRDPEGHWFGLTMRARVIYASKERVKQDAITYEELAQPKWKGRLCTRSGQHLYNTSLFATLIEHMGEAATEVWLKGVKANLARRPAGGDREQVRDVHAGLCDIALGNSYYMAAMLKSPQQRAWAESVRIIFPDANGRGSHVNISGAAVTRHAKHRESAIKLLEFLASDEGQALYAEKNNEYPIVPSVPLSEVVRSWGTLKPDPVPLSAIAKHRKRASELVDKVGFDAGPTN